MNWFAIRLHRSNFGFSQSLISKGGHRIRPSPSKFQAQLHQDHSCTAATAIGTEPLLPLSHAVLLFTRFLLLFLLLLLCPLIFFLGFFWGLGFFFGVWGFFLFLVFLFCFFCVFVFLLGFFPRRVGKDPEGSFL